MPHLVHAPCVDYILHYTLHLPVFNTGAIRQSDIGSISPANILGNYNVAYWLHLGYVRCDVLVEFEA